MASMVSKRPAAGIAAGIFFGALGLLIIQTDGSTGMTKGLRHLLAGIVGYVLLCVAALSVISSLVRILRSTALRKKQEEPLVSTRSGRESRERQDPRVR
jgi:hypothetical protein